MKYWNQRKRARAGWTKIEVKTPFAAAKVWCQQHESKNRFYSGPYTHVWYFENSQDALAFKLKFYA